MSDSYMGEIRMFAGNFAPQGWALCDGSLLQISSYNTLFVLLDTNFGGDGITTFGLPDLRSRVPMHMGNMHPFSRPGGLETVTLTAQQMAAHSHPFMATNGASAATPANNLLSKVDGGSHPKSNLYTAATGVPVVLAPTTITPGGAGSSQPQPHSNIQPYLSINFIISLNGVFPPRA